MPDAERKEVEDIFRAKGFDGKDLQMVVNKIILDKKVWIETMMTDELWLSPEKKSPFKAGLSTLGAFIIAGMIPLVTYLVGYSNELPIDPFILSCAVTELAFVLIGYIKTYVTKIRFLRSVSETLLLGMTAAAVAYFVGDFLQGML